MAKVYIDNISIKQELIYLRNFTDVQTHSPVDSDF